MLALTAPDGERMDGHRRLLKWISNHLLVNDVTFADEKDAVRNERNFVVVEGLGFTVATTSTPTPAAAWSAWARPARWCRARRPSTCRYPPLHPSAPGGGPADELTIKLKRVLPGGQDEVVATGVDASLAFAPTAPGAYRAEVWMVPNHLTPHLGPTRETYLVPTPWILTNHLYLQ